VKERKMSADDKNSEPKGMFSLNFDEAEQVTYTAILHPALYSMILFFIIVARGGDYLVLIVPVIQLIVAAYILKTTSLIRSDEKAKSKKWGITLSVYLILWCAIVALIHNVPSLAKNSVFMGAFVGPVFGVACIFLALTGVRLMRHHVGTQSN
jgi:hypothetical protein